MKEILDVLLDALIDTAKLLPVLLVVYYLIEYLEYKKILKTNNSKLLNGKYSPVFGSLIGCIPQCGFSVVSTDMFSNGQLSIGALIAVYIATSDEALPMMIANPSTMLDLVLLLAVKIVWGIIVGYSAMLLYSKIFKKKESISNNVEESPKYIEVNGELINVEGLEVDMSHACTCEYCSSGKKFKWYGPILKSLKIALYILVINIILGLIVYWIGEDNISKFLSSSYHFQPIFAIIVGLIPNCASSILLTQLYINGSISFGSIVAGLSVNAGLGIVVLIKQNKNIKENIFILGVLIVSALIIGYALHYIPINI